MAKWKKLPNGNFLNLEAVAHIGAVGEHTSITLMNGETIAVRDKSPHDIINGEDYTSVK